MDQVRITRTIANGSRHTVIPILPMPKNRQGIAANSKSRIITPPSRDRSPNCLQRIWSFVKWSVSSCGTLLYAFGKSCYNIWTFFKIKLFGRNTLLTYLKEERDKVTDLLQAFVGLKAKSWEQILPTLTQESQIKIEAYLKRQIEIRPDLNEKIKPKEAKQLQDLIQTVKLLSAENKRRVNIFWFNAFILVRGDIDFDVKVLPRAKNAARSILETLCNSKIRLRDKEKKVRVQFEKYSLYQQVTIKKILNLAFKYTLQNPADFQLVKSAIIKGPETLLSQPIWPIIRPLQKALLSLDIQRF